MNVESGIKLWAATVSGEKRIPQNIEDGFQAASAELERLGYTGMLQSISHSVTPLANGSFLVTVFVIRQRP